MARLDTAYPAIEALDRAPLIEDDEIDPDELAEVRAIAAEIHAERAQTVRST
jgi:hypothetical protein